MRRGLTDRRLGTERKLFDVNARIHKVKDELAILEEQAAALGEEADEARVRMLVSETPIADREYHDASGHAAVIARRRDEARALVAELEARQDELLSKLVL